MLLLNCLTCSMPKLINIYFGAVLRDITIIIWKPGHYNISYNSSEKAEIRLVQCICNFSAIWTVHNTCTCATLSPSLMPLWCSRGLTVLQSSQLNFSDVDWILYGMLEFWFRQEVRLTFVSQTWISWSPCHLKLKSLPLDMLFSHFLLAILCPSYLKLLV